MSDEKIKVTWDDINQKNKQRETVDWSQTVISTPAASNALVMKKNFIGIVVVIIVFIALGIFWFANKSGKDQIEAVLIANTKVTEGLDDKSPSDRFNIMVGRMRSINLVECPKEFQKTYRHYTEAVAKLIPIIQAKEEMGGWGNMFSSFIIGCISGYTGHYELAMGKIASDMKASNELGTAGEHVIEEIKSTFQEVLRVAQKYKVDTAPYSN